MVAAVRAWWSFWSQASTSNGTNPTVRPPLAASSPRAAGAASTGALDAAASLSTRPRSRRTSPESLPAVANLLSPEFKMWDAYGLYSHMRVKGRRHLTREGAVRFLQRLGHEHHMEVQVLDVAVAEGSLCCFTHWRVVLKPKWQKAVTSEEMDPEVVGAAAAGKAVAEAVRRSRVAAAGVEAAVAEVEAAAAAEASSSSSSSGDGGSSQPGVVVGGGLQDTRSGWESASVQGEGMSDRGTRVVPSVTDTPYPTPDATGSSGTHEAAAAVADQPSASPAAAAVAAASGEPAGHSGQEYVVEGMEVDVFDDELQVHDIWLFRGPLEAEQRLFLSGRTTAVSAAEQQAHAAQEQERLLEVRGGI